MNNSMVGHNFAHSRPGKGSSFSTDGITAWSYYTAIAINHEGTFFISSNSMSSSTSKHIQHIQRGIGYSSGFSTPAFRYGNHYAPSALQCITAAAEEMTAKFNEILRSRKYKEMLVESYNIRLQEIKDLADKFKIVALPAMPKITGDIEQIARDMAAKLREENKRKKAALTEKQRLQQIEDFELFTSWIKTGSRHFPSSYRQVRNDFITVRGNEVITSQGAVAPLSHVIKALEFYESRKCDNLNPLDATLFEAYKTNSHKIHLGNFILDEITENGGVKAGCHFFTAKTIQEFKNQWREVLYV